MNDKSADRFRRSFARNLDTRRRSREGLWRILSFFNERGLDVMLIKGASIDLFETGSGPYTVSRDIDLIVRARDEDLPHDILAEILAFSDGFPLEYDFYGHHDIDMNGLLPIDWDRVWEDAVPVHYSGRDFYIMSQEDALIAACINACRKRYFNLKALVNIDRLLRTTSSYYSQTFVDKAWAYKCNDIACAALMVAGQLMGTPLVDNALPQLSSTKARFVMLRNLVSRNSFTTLSTLYNGSRVAGRPIQQSLLLPYASYRSDQIWAKLKFVVRSRSPHTTPIEQGRANGYSP